MSHRVYECIPIDKVIHAGDKQIAAAKRSQHAKHGAEHVDGERARRERAHDLCVMWRERWIV